MRRSFQFLLVLLMIGTLTACGTSGDSESSKGSELQTSPGASEKKRLRDDFDDALSIQNQLAVGTLLLEETELAVDQTLAAELLPLWRAAQSLMNSDTAAALEIEAIYNQIQDTMSADQIAAIAEMELTEEALATMMEEGELFFGQGSFAGGRGEGTEGEERSPGEGFPGGPGGGIPGGRPGGGPGGGFPEGIDPEVMATRQAQFSEGGRGSSQDRALTMAVIRTLETKTGEVSEDRPPRLFDIVYNVIIEATGLSMEEIQTKTAEGEPLAEIVEDSGGDLKEVRTALIEALGEVPNAADLDLEQLADERLGLGD